MILLLITIFIFLKNSNGSLSSGQKLYPEYHSVSPCPCDLTEGDCDGECCLCDKDCELIFANITCSLSTKNPSFPEKANPFLSLSWMSSPYLGNFYKYPETLSSLGELENRLHLVRSSSKRKLYDQWSAARYERISGHPIRTIDGKSLKLPYHSFNGKCTAYATVDYLRPRKSHCRAYFRLDDCLLEEGPLYDLKSFLTNSPDKKNYEILSRIYVNEELSDEEVPLLIRYYLASDVGPYLNEKPYPQTLTNGIFQTYDYTLLKGINRKNMYNKSVCKNVVLEAIYKFWWAESNITKVSADILLGHVSFSTNASYGMIDQFFQLEFVREPLKQTEDHEFDLRDNITIIEGYVRDQPILVQKDDVTQDYLRIYRPSSSPDSCRELNLTETILFGENSFSGCRFLFSYKDFGNCTKLKEEISSIIIDKFMFLSAARGWKENSSKDPPFVKVVYERIPSFNEILSPILMFCNAPTHLKVDIIYTDNLVSRINGVKVSVIDSSWIWTEVHEEEMSFELFLSVHFLRISTNSPFENYTKFWREQNKKYCPGDVCWKDLFYLLTDVDDLVYRTQCTLSLIPLILFFLWFIRDSVSW